MFSTRKRRLEASWSETKSIHQRWLGRSGSGIGVLGWISRLRRRFGPEGHARQPVSSLAIDHQAPLTQQGMQVASSRSGGGRSLSLGDVPEAAHRHAASPGTEPTILPGLAIGRCFTALRFASGVTTFPRQSP